MKTSRLSRRLESIIKFIVQIFPFIILLFQSLIMINSIECTITEAYDIDFFTDYLDLLNSAFLNNLTGEGGGGTWFDIFGLKDIYYKINDFFGLDKNVSESYFLYIFLYIGWLIFVEFLFLIKDILLSCPRIVSKFINKLTGGDLD